MKSKMQKREGMTGLAIVVPMTVYFFIFTIIPFFMLFYYSFTDLGRVYGQEKFVGFLNYVNFFRYKEYFMSFVSTVIISLFVVASEMTLGLGVALMLNGITKCKGFFRTLWYLPTLVSLAVVSKVLNTMLAFDGTLNRLFGTSIPWHDSTEWMYFWIIFVVVWKGLGGRALLFLAGLNGIPKDVYEAAKIDGASRMQSIWHITLPLLRPMTGFVLITSFIGSFNIFEPVQLISNGGPNQETKVILFRIYDEAFKNGAQGFASAISVLMLIVVMILTFFNMKFTDSNILKSDKKMRNEG